MFFWSLHFALKLFFEFSLSYKWAFNYHKGIKLTTGTAVYEIWIIYLTHTEFFRTPPHFTIKNRRKILSYVI